MIIFYHFVWYYLIFSIFGWCVESALVSFQQKKFVNRGFLTGPICPIYGTAMCIIIGALTPLKSSWILLLVGGGVIACAVEYFIGWQLEKMFHQRWWDYSDHKYNLNGRVAIPESLAWGPLTALAMKFAVPWIDTQIDRIPVTGGAIFLASVFVICMTDYIRLIYKMRFFERIAGEFDALREKLLNSAADSAEQLIENFERLRKKLRASRANNRVRHRLEGAYPRLSSLWRKVADYDKKKDDSD